MFTPRLAWTVSKCNTTSKRARTGGASYMDKNRIKLFNGISVKEGVHSETCHFGTLHL